MDFLVKLDQNLTFLRHSFLSPFGKAGITKAGTEKYLPRKAGTEGQRPGLAQNFPREGRDPKGRDWDWISREGRD